jgi:hypothetical protein
MQIHARTSSVRVNKLWGMACDVMELRLGSAVAQYVPDRLGGIFKSCRPLAGVGLPI